MEAGVWACEWTTPLAGPGLCAEGSPEGEPDRTGVPQDAGAWRVRAAFPGALRDGARERRNCCAPMGRSSSTRRRREGWALRCLGPLGGSREARGTRESCLPRAEGRGPGEGKRRRLDQRPPESAFTLGIDWEGPAGLALPPSGPAKQVRDETQKQRVTPFQKLQSGKSGSPGECC